MLTLEKSYQIQPPSAPNAQTAFEAERALAHPIRHITDICAPLSEGGPHDFYSNADYFWPDPSKPDGLPYMNRDGETNPGNFDEHRHIMRQMRRDVCALAQGYQQDKKDAYAQRAVQILQEFFLLPETRMNPRLTYAQAIPGRCPGRNFGIIDTIHIAELPFAIEALKDSPAMEKNVYQGLKDWFTQYLGWLLTSKNGIEEAVTTNNHAICYFVQVAAFALFTDNLPIIEMCRNRYKTHLLPQMAPKGSFPRELGRTKPYNYSIFALDNIATLCQMLSSPEDDLWIYQTEKGVTIKNGIDFLLPYLQNKSLWPYPKDIMHFEDFPVKSSFMLFAGYRFGMDSLLELYDTLPSPLVSDEASRNNAIQYPKLLL